MTSIDSTTISNTLGNDPIVAPPGVELDTPEKEQIYRAAQEFERIFLKEITKGINLMGSMNSEDSDTSSLQGYSDLAQDQFTKSMLDSGGLGLAASLYNSFAEQAGLNITKDGGK